MRRTRTTTRTSSTTKMMTAPSPTRILKETPSRRERGKAWAATPPVTQVYVGSSLALTLGSFFLAGNQWPSWLNLDWKKVMTGQLGFRSGVLYPFKRGQ